jgi:hypothetical protein
MIHQEIYDFLQLKKNDRKNPFFEKYLRTKQAGGSNNIAKKRTIDVVKNCTDIIFMLVENKLSTIKMVQEFLHMIYSELEHQEIKLSCFYDEELDGYDPVSIRKVEELFDFMLPILKDKLRDSNLNNYFSITIRNVKNQIKHLNVTYLTTTEEIKKECNKKNKHCIKDIVLIYKGKKLEDTILKYTGVSEGDTIYIVWIEKKKPVYTSPPLSITYPTRTDEYPRRGMSASAPAPPSKSRFSVTNYHYNNSSSSDDDYEELKNMFG